MPERENTEKNRLGGPRLAAAIVVGTVLALLAAEGVLRAFVAPSELLAANTDAYWREQFRAAPRLADDIEHDPHLGWRMRRDHHADGVTHDADGHRMTPTPGPIDLSKRPVVFLGDSFTYGLGVRDDETYAAKFAVSERGRSVVNLAANGHGVDQQVLAFELDGARLHPELVVLGYFVDDFRRNELSFREAPKPRFALDGGELRNPVESVPTPDEVRASLHAPSELGSYAWAALTALRRRLNGTRGAFVSDEEFTEHARMSERLLARLKAACDALGAQLCVLTIPHCTYDGYPDTQRIETAIESSCAKLEIVCLPTRAVCREAESQGVVVYGSNCHWSAAGHALIARALADKVGALGLLR